MSRISIQQAMEIALQHHQAARLDEAESLYRQVLAQQPQHSDAIHLLGMIAWDRGQLQIAEQFITRAIQLNPNSAVYYSNLGMLLMTQNRLEQVVPLFQKAIQLSPDLVDAHFNLGVALARNNQFDAAADAYRHAIQLDPNHADAWSNLGNVLDLMGKLDESIHAFQQAVTLKSDGAEFLSNLSDALARKGRSDEAIESARRALSIQPDLAEAGNHLGNALREQGRVDEAIIAYRNALCSHPENATIHSNLIYAMHFDPAQNAQTIADEHARWRKQFASNISTLYRPENYNRDPDRPLRIGYVSPDFRDHCQSFFTLPLLSNHDKRQFEIYCYASVAREDAISERLKQHTQGWRNIAGMTDRAAAELIQRDRIDILVDLTLHMAGNRIAIFTHKPAPIQVTWLGYPSSTGLISIDYRLTDRHLDSGSNDAHYTEQSVYLESFWCYGPLSDHPPVQPKTGPFTFGCLNSFAKINPLVLALWAKVLNAVPDSKMVILTHPGSHRNRVSDALAKLSVASARIEFVDPRPRPAYLELFHRIDISLDTFPANGHTTTMDSLWMGVPVITLPGPTAISRGALSILRTIGLPELCATTEDDYVSIARDLTNDPTRLQSLRSTLRSRMLNSPLMDAPRFTRNMEAAFRQMWKSLR